jgi:predicted  nucleic acid-binding Zn-ribbon protein
MKLKNEALQKLYDTIVNCTIAISPHADSSMDKAVKECDEKLSESVTFDQLKNLQDRNDILEKSNGTLLDANLDLCTKNRDLKDRISILEKELDEAKSSVNYFKASRDDWRSRAKHEEEEKIEQVKRADNLAEQVKKDKQWLEHSRLEWAKRAVKRGKEINEANEKNKDLTTQFDELKSQYQKLSIENKRLQYDYNTLHRKYSECQGTVDKQAEQIRHLKDRLNNISNACGRTQDDIYGHGYEQGQTDLWEALQNVGDVKPWDISSFYPDVSSMDDIISWDMEDFLDEYKKWQEDIKKTYEQKETDRMREWLVDFCWGRVCEGCPLESKEYKCGCGYSFKMTDPSDTRIIPDKDIKRYYEKARGCGRYTLKDAKLFATTVEGVNRAITKACEGFCEAVRDADTKITENLRKGCTLEAKVEVNKDLLNKVCGVKPEDEKSKPEELVITTRGVTTANYSEVTMNAIKEAVRKFEKSLPALDSWESTITGSIKVNDPDHKFEYGDAVRLPWRDYDYMYIDADKNHIRLFNPKTHTVVLVSPSEKLTYQGCKIVLTNEDDLRKIWKDKK